MTINHPIGLLNQTTNPPTNQNNNQPIHQTISPSPATGDSRSASRTARLRQQLGVVAIGCATTFGAAAVYAQSSMQPQTRPAPPGGQSTEQPSAAPSGPSGPSAAQPSKAQIAARFNSADVDADGKLTKEEAKTSMPGVYDNFDRIDTKGQGFITVQDLTVAMGR